MKRGLEGKGPTPRAEDRPYHKAHKAKTAKETAGKRSGGPRRRTSDAEWIAGRNPVVEALRERVPVTSVYVAEGAERDGRMREVFRLAAEHGVGLLEVSRGELDRLTNGAVHQGMAAQDPAVRVRPRRRPDRRRRGDGREAPHRRARRGHRPAQPRRRRAQRRRLRRPRRRDPGAPRGVDDRVGLEDVAGAAARIPVAQTVNLTRQLKAYQDAGCFVVGLAADGDLTLPELVATPTSPAGRSSLVVGSEGDGLHRLVAETCDRLVSIPMAGVLESLNAGVAASVALYAIADRRARL